MSRMLNVPNLISVLRGLLAPVIVYLLAQSAYDLAFLIFLGAGVSDAVDGFIARRFNLYTPLGAIIDPVADKLVILSSLLMLTWLGLLPLWLTLVILARDIVIAGGALAYRSLTGHVEITPTLFGKAHTFLLYGMIAVILGNGAAIVDASSWLSILFGLTFLTAVVSGTQYVWIWASKTTHFLSKRP